MLRKKSSKMLQALSLPSPTLPSNKKRWRGEGLYIYWGIFLSSFAFLVYFIQMQLFLNSDVASLLYDTELFLSGGTYVKDFFETNPPMIFILYSPIVFLQKMTALNVNSLTYIYIIFIALFSLAFCSVLIDKIISKKDYFLKNAILIVLLFVFLIIPINDFGQREHLLLIMAIPYLFMVAARAKHVSIHIVEASFAGLMAGLVFSLKPFFLFPIVFVELYLMVIKKNIWSWIRVDFLILLTVMISYVVYVYLCHPLYFNVMLPMISQFYFKGTQETWLVFFSEPKVIFSFIVAGCYFLFFKKNDFNELTQVLFLALVGFILAFVVPRSAWGYHVLPAYGIALLLSVICIYEIWSSEINQKLLKTKELVFIALASFAMPIAIYYKEIQYTIDVQKINRFFAEIKKMPYRSIYCFSASTAGVCFPVVTMHKREFSGRFPMFWWLMGLRKIELEYGGSHRLPANILNEKNYFIDAIAYDLDHYKPELIISYNLEEKMILPEGYNYPMYFSEQASFKNAWSHYQWIENFGSFTLYRRVL